jgi:DNA-binding CsgD family transcriptional regulator
MSLKPITSSDEEHHRHAELAARRQRMTLIIVDAHLCVRNDSIAPTDRELRLLLSDDRQTFRDDIIITVKALVDECVQSHNRHSRIAFLDGHRFVRVTRLDGDTDTLYAVTVEYFRGGDSLSRAARKYGLTRREIEVLALILEGARATEIARSLQIAETTVQGYYKRLLSKTQSRTRPSMVANVLDWGGAARRRSAPMTAPPPLVP